MSSDSDHPVRHEALWYTTDVAAWIHKYTCPAALQARMMFFLLGGSVLSGRCCLPALGPICCFLLLFAFCREVPSSPVVAAPRRSARFVVSFFFWQPACCAHSYPPWRSWCSCSLYVVGGGVVLTAARDRQRVWTTTGGEDRRRSRASSAIARVYWQGEHGSFFF